MTLKSEALEFVENFTLCEMDEVDLILMETFSKTRTMDVREKPMHLIVCSDSKGMTLKPTKTPMARGGKLNLVPKDLMKNEQLIIMVQMEQIHRL